VKNEVKFLATHWKPKQSSLSHHWFLSRQLCS